MPSIGMLTEIQSFYRGKTVLLTGGTGFLGKVFIERILRTTEVKCIFMLARAKKGKNVQDRVDEMLNEPLFDSLRSQRNDTVKRIVPINGDCLMPELAISAEDRAMLIEKVNVVMHSAATVRFNEPLATAVAINVRATLDLLQLAKEMKHLVAFVHVSSAFANCVEEHIEEQFYPDKLNGCTARQICKMSDDMGDECLNSKSDVLCGKFPNTYCFTKALAEEAVLADGADLPISVFRPAIVVPTFKDPMPGWIDNLFGPTAVLLGGLCGVLRVVYVNVECNASLVPVDFCAGLMIASCWQTAVNHSEKKTRSPPLIYNFVPHEQNDLKWGQYHNGIKEFGLQMPLSGAIWYPFVIMTKSKFLYNILWFLYHTIPGHIGDFVLSMLGKPKKLLDTYAKIYRQTSAVEYFVDKQWTFGTNNTRRLWQRMSKEDRQLFDFDMASINWPEYINSSIIGIRYFLAKEDVTTIPKALRRLQFFKFLHYALQAALAACCVGVVIQVV